MPFLKQGQKTILPFLLTFIVIATQNSAFSAAQPLITSSVKLRVDAAAGHSWGTGTIIDAREGEALILTCGHIFRDSLGKGNIEVHLFGENSTVCVSGRCLYYDVDEVDLGLVIIEPPCPVHAIPIAPVSYQIQPPQQTWSVGCDHGGNPTVRTHQIMSIDKISDAKIGSVPFHYIQVSGAPVSGRSGGGLFSAEGFLIGVCNTAGPTVNDGHFVPPHMIRHVLDKMNLAFVYTNPSLAKPLEQEPVVQLAELTPLTPIDSTTLIGTESFNTVPLDTVALDTVPSVDGLQATIASKFADNAVAHNPVHNAGTITAQEQATLEEIKRRKQDGDEVILIVRSRRNPEIPSDVIVLNGTSEQFLEALVNAPPQSSGSTYNPVILSSHESEQPERQPVSFPIKY